MRDTRPRIMQCPSHDWCDCHCPKIWCTQASYRPGRPRRMRSEHTIVVERRGEKLYVVLPDGTTRPHKGAKSDLPSLEAMTDEEVLAAAHSDNPPLTPAQLK